MANKKGSHQLTWEDRIRLEALLKAGHRVVEIAEQLGVHRATIYNELKRGQYEHRNSDYTVEMRYSPEIAQRKAEENLKVRGTQLKIASDLEYANYLEGRILRDDLSPEAVLGELKEKGLEEKFQTRICTVTLYSYIDKGIFLRLTNKDLPVKGKRKRQYRKVQRIRKRVAAGDSIEQRPEAVSGREEFGNWEMDSVVGKRGKSKGTFLTLTERKTRNEIIFKLPDHTDESVVAALDCLERKWGQDMFRRVFQTITVDNGSEFADVNGLERSVFAESEKRTHVYYCHPYSSWERGSNENANRMIRRKAPKGTDLDAITNEDVKRIEEWLNGYPRRIFGYKTAGELFRDELEKIS